MKFLFLTISLSTLFSFYSTAQSADSLSKPRRFQLGVNYSQDYDYRILMKNYGDGTTENIIEMRDTTEIPKFGYTTGINGGFNFNPHIGIELGVQYSNKGYQMKDLTIVTNQGPQGPSYGTANARYNYHYIDVPLKVNLTFGKKKLQFFGSTGLVANIFIKEIDKTVLYLSDGVEEHKFESNYDYEPVNLSAMLSAGVSYKLTDRATLRLEPTVRYGLTDIIDKTPITARFYNAGLNVGYYLSF